MGSIVHLTFLDHCMRSGIDGKGPVVCEVFGRVVDQDKTSVTVAAWLVEETLSDDSETFVILKSAIKKAKALK